MDVKQIGRRIKGFRKLKGYTQAEFAKRVHISAYMLGSIEQGKRHPSDELVETICGLLRISKDELMDTVDRGMDAEV